MLATTLTAVQALAELVRDNQLLTEKRVNRPMSLADITRQIDCTMRTTEGSFKVEEVRI